MGETIDLVKRKAEKHLKELKDLVDSYADLFRKEGFHGTADALEEWYETLTKEEKEDLDEQVCPHCEGTASWAYRGPCPHCGWRAGMGRL